MAFRAAVRHPGRVGGLIVVGAEAARVLPAEEDRPQALDERARNVDERLAPEIWKTVTRKGWKDNSFPAEAYSRDTAAARRLRKDANDDPMSVLIRYLAEFLASELRPLFPEVEVPTLVVRPGFSEESLELRQMYLRFFHESWDGAEEANDLIEVETVPESRVFVWRDRPEAFDRLLDGFVERVGGVTGS